MIRWSDLEKPTMGDEGLRKMRENLRKRLLFRIIFNLELSVFRKLFDWTYFKRVKTKGYKGERDG